MVIVFLGLNGYDSVLSVNTGVFLERMDYQSITEQLLVLLEDHHVQIRKEAMGGNGGGLCCLRGKNVLIIDQESSSLETAISCAKAVESIISDMEGIYLKPAVREFIDKYVSDG